MRLTGCECVIRAARDDTLHAPYGGFQGSVRGVETQNIAFLPRVRKLYTDPENALRQSKEGAKTNVNVIVQVNISHIALYNNILLDNQK